MGLRLLVALVAWGALTAAEPLRVGVADPICRDSACSCVGDGAVRSYAGVFARLEERGLGTSVRYFEDPILLERQVAAGAIEVMICKSWDGWQAALAAKRPFTRVADVSRADGTTGLRGMFLVRSDSPLQRIVELTGRVVGVGNESGYEKGVLGRGTLERAGIVPSRMVELGACSELALAVKERTLDAAVVSDYAVEQGCVVVVGTKDEFRTIGTTDRAIPFVSVFVADSVEAGLRQRLVEELLSMQGPAVPAGLDSAGFVAATPWEPGSER
jgi:ABC-type phosphate/phosphonate transport system substrate-binding protein